MFGLFEQGLFQRWKCYWKMNWRIRAERSGHPSRVLRTDRSPYFVGGASVWGRLRSPLTQRCFFDDVFTRRSDEKLPSKDMRACLLFSDSAQCQWHSWVAQLVASRVSIQSRRNLRRKPALASFIDCQLGTPIARWKKPLLEWERRRFHCIEPSNATVVQQIPLQRIDG